MAYEAADEALAARLDRNYRAQRHVYDLTRKYYLLGRDRLIETLQPPPGGHVLELGSGTARNLIAIARCYPTAHLYGIDLSTMMLEEAARSLRRSGLAARIRLAHGDATSCDAGALLGRTTFDRIVLSYAVSMIPPWEAALDHACGLLAPGGSLHIVDFGRGEGLPGLANRVLRAWLAGFHVTPRDGLETVLGHLAARHGLDLACAQTHRGYAVSAVLRAPPGKPIGAARFPA